MELCSERGDTRKVNLILTPTRPPSPLGGQEGVNPHHSLAGMKANSLLTANEKSSLPEQQILRMDSGAPAGSARSESWEQDGAWGLPWGMILGIGSSPSPGALWLRSGMRLRREPAKSRPAALQKHPQLFHDFPDD